MPLDVLTEIEIARPRAEVAAFAADPDNAPRWNEAIVSVQHQTPWPLEVGSRFAIVTQVLGQPLQYTYEIQELVPGERFVIRTEDGPFALETSYAWSDLPGGGTQMTLRNCGEPKRFSKVSAKLMATAMRRANRGDLERLKAILEGSVSG